MYRLFIFCLFLSVNLRAQTMQGTWKGYFYTDPTDENKDIISYNFEVQMVELEKNQLKAVTISSIKNSFLSKAVANGIYDKQKKNIQIKEYLINDVKFEDKNNTCLMDCDLNLIKQKNGYILKGRFKAKNNKTNLFCGTGLVYIEKVNEKTNSSLLTKFIQTKNNKNNISRLDTTKLNKKEKTFIKGENKFMRILNY